MDRVHAVHEVGAVRRLAQRALDLFVALVADEDDPIPLLGEATRFDVDLVDEGAGGVDDTQVSSERLGPHRG